MLGCRVGGYACKNISAYRVAVWATRGRAGGRVLFAHKCSDSSCSTLGNERARPHDLEIGSGVKINIFNIYKHKKDITPYKKTTNNSTELKQFGLKQSLLQVQGVSGAHSGAATCACGPTPTACEPEGPPSVWKKRRSIE
jgi:hypothetical protein